MVLLRREPTHRDNHWDLIRRCREPRVVHRLACTPQVLLGDRAVKNAVYGDPGYTNCLDEIPFHSIGDRDDSIRALVESADLGQLAALGTPLSLAGLTEGVRYTDKTACPCLREITQAGQYGVRQMGGGHDNGGARAPEVPPECDQRCPFAAGLQVHE